MDLPAPSARLSSDWYDPRRTASPGIHSLVCSTPRFRHGLHASTPRECLHPLSATGYQPGRTFRSRGFSPPQRFTPHPNFEHFAARARRGSSRFRSVAPNGEPSATADPVSRTAPFPATHHTLRRILLASSRTASLRPLPSCRFASRCTAPASGSRSCVVLGRSLAPCPARGLPYGYHACHRSDRPSRSEERMASRARRLESTYGLRPASHPVG